MKAKNIILFFFATLTIVIQGCNSDKEQVESIKNRLYKIGILTSSNNKGTSYLNVLDDSINIIKFDINSSKLKENNKVVLTKILDSISGDILISRMTNCIIGEHYSISSTTWKQMIAKVKNLPIGQGIMDAYTEELNKELSLNNITITVYIKENNKCEIVTTYYSAMADLQAKIWGGLLGDLQKPSKKEFGTYKYIGDNTFEISNKMVLKIKDNQNCKAELSIKIPTEEEIRNTNSKNKDTLLVNKKSDSKPIPSSPVKIQMLYGSIRIGNLEVAQNISLPLKNWSDAKKACSSLGKGFRLPTKDELNLIYQNRSKLNGYGNLYFSSSEPEYNPNSVVWIQNLTVENRVMALSLKKITFLPLGLYNSYISS